jgi:hypothetical protein
MKKITVTISAWVIPLITNAQSADQMFADTNMLKIYIAVICMGLAMLFILGIFKRFFDYQIKNKAFELRISEELASVVLSENPENDRKTSIKWFFIFAGLGIGLTIIHYTLPWGTHSLAIIAFSLAAVFLGYFFYIRLSEK